MYQVQVAQTEKYYSAVLVQVNLADEFPIFDYPMTITVITVCHLPHSL